MGATEDGFHALARAEGIELVRRATFPGLSNRGHTDPALDGVVPSSTLAALERIHVELGGVAHLLESKRPRPLEIDFYAPDLGLLIEVDEIQHFTSDRQHALERFPLSDEHAALISSYLAAIAQWRERADRYRAAKPAADFPHPGGRRAQRAYLDSARDLLAPSLGLRVIRVRAPECEPKVAFRSFEQELVTSIPLTPRTPATA